MQLSPEVKQDIINNFHKLYYDSSVFGGTWRSTSFLGIPIQKAPMEMYMYQEILFDTKPDLIIETGIAYGGGALYLASICELMNHGNVVSIDISDTGNLPKHSRLKYLFGSSVSNEILDQLKKEIIGKKRVMVILDSDHSKKHVLEELKLYCDFVTAGNYLIVEDTNVNGHPVQPDHGPGPMEALEEFLALNKDFESDKSKERLYLTFNPKGYLKRLG
ncbi:cephalosporin hydroxylase [candidate division WWE3 bacterium]|nr:cephalosporin hydroxylase [candidate division WWE3 bacterium]